MRAATCYQAVRQWYEIQANHNHYVSNTVADAAANVINLAGLVLNGALDARRRTDPEFEQRYIGLSFELAHALTDVQAAMRERLQSVKNI